MATIIGMTGIQLTDGQMQQLVKGLTTAIATAAGFDEEKVSMTILPPLPPYCSSKGLSDSILLLSYAAGESKLHKKKKMIENMCAVAADVTGVEEDHVVVIFRPGNIYDYAMDGMQVAERIKKRMEESK